MTHRGLNKAPEGANVGRMTPGPWTARGGGNAPFLREDPDMMAWSSGVDCIAPFTENEAGGFERVEEQTVATARGRTLAEAEANARAIAALPDLIEALTFGAQADLPAFLEWVADRLVYVHGDDENLDFVLSLRARAKKARAVLEKAGAL